MDANVAWFTLINACCFFTGLLVLWHIARRELGDKTEELPRRSWKQTLEDRLEQLIVHPPTWRALAQRLRPLLLAGAVLVVCGLGGWTLWSHASDLASAISEPPVPSTPVDTLPFAGAVNLLKGVGLLAFAVGLPLGFITGSRSLIQSSVLLGVCIVAATILMPVTTIPDHASLLAAEPATQQREQAAPQLREPDAAWPQPSMCPVNPTAHSPASTAATQDTDSSFGVSDALMLYGAYKLLTDDGPSADSSVRQSSSSAARTTLDARRPTPPTYKPPVSSTKPIGARARLSNRPTFRRGR